MTFVWHFLEACTGFIHYMFSLAYFPNLVWRNLAKNRTKEKSFTLSPMASNLKLLPVFWCEHVWNNIISRAICWWRLMHVFTFSVRHYKPRTCYKKSGSRCGTNRQGHHAEPTNNSCCFGVYSKGDCRCKAERVHGMCWCDTHAWLQYDGGISRSCCYGSCWSFRSNVQYSAWNWRCLETHCTSHWMTWIESLKQAAVMW